MAGPVCRVAVSKAVQIPHTLLLTGTVGTRDDVRV